MQNKSIIVHSRQKAATAFMQTLAAINDNKNPKNKMLRTINLYRINQQSHHFKATNSRKEIIQKVINAILKKYKRKEKISIDGIPSIEKENIIYYLFVQNFSNQQSDWHSFLPPELSGNINFDISHLNLVLFIDNGSELFLVVGGKAYQAVVPYIDHSFGLLVASKLIKPEKDIIVSINSRGLTGSRAGLSEQYRNEFKIIDHIRFGKVPTELHLILCKETSNEHFNFVQKKANEKVKIYAGKSFKIKKSFDFQLLDDLIREMQFILEKVPNDYLSTYIEVRDYEQEQEFHKMLMNELYNELGYIGKTTNTKDKRFKFDFCHPDKIREFYEADSYVLKEKVENTKQKYNEFKVVENREEIYEAVMRRALDEVGNNNLFEFKKYIQGVRVISYSGKKLQTSASFIYHFTAEFNSANGGKPVFLVDTRWYILNQSFIEDLKSQCKQTIISHRLPKGILDLPWNKAVTRKEADYNLSYQGKKNYIVLDTFTPDGIELSDILYVETDKIYLIHVKYGFDASMRELSNQVLLSAKRLQSDIKSGKYDYINKIYERAKDRTNLSDKEFKELFKRKIIYVFAFTSGLYGDELVEEHINKYRSNIARYSLIQCNKDMQSFNFELNIHQIRKN